jgi:hypothetical protein
VGEEFNLLQATKPMKKLDQIPVPTLKQLVTHVYPEQGTYSLFKVNGIIKHRDTCIQEINSGQFQY